MVWTCQQHQLRRDDSAGRCTVPQHYKSCEEWRDSKDEEIENRLPHVQYTCTHRARIELAQDARIPRSVADSVIMSSCLFLKPYLLISVGTHNQARDDSWQPQDLSKDCPSSKVIIKLVWITKSFPRPRSFTAVQSKGAGSEASRCTCLFVQQYANVSSISDYDETNLTYFHYHSIYSRSLLVLHRLRNGVDRAQPSAFPACL